MRGYTVLIEGCPHVRGDLYEGFHCNQVYYFPCNRIISSLKSAGYLTNHFL